MSKQVFVLAHSTARNRAMHAVSHAPEGHMVVISEPTKKRIQEEKYHAQILDISKVWVFLGQKWHAEDCKRLLVDAFAKVMRDAGTPLHHDARVVQSIDGQRVVQMGIQTREFYVREASEFIEYLNAFGDEIGVVWSEPKILEPA